MERFLMDELVAWKDRPRRKPLILNGARQVGKTWLLKEFGRTQFENVAYVNLDDNPRMREQFELGYDIPRNKVFDALNISRLNVYGSVDNLFMLTNYLGYNPDVDYNGSSNLTPGVDFGTYPLSRTFSVGLKLTFN